MTEVVTASAALSQLNLLAQRQQGFSIDRSASDDSSATNVDSSQAQPFHPGQAVKALRFDDQGASAGHHDDAPPPKPKDGPSRPRVEIRSFDVGLTPSEVVGTPDILQRFDENGDGRVDLMESEKATLARQKVTTFAGLAAAPRKEAPAKPAGVVGTGAEQVAATADTPKKLFTGDAAAVADATVPKKIFTDAQVAAEGVPTATVDVPKKFYGQGAEVIVGAVTPPVDPSAKVSDKAVAKEQAVREQGTGETTAPDKVSQTDTDQSQDQTADDSGKLFEKAQALVAALHGNKKAAVEEVVAYANVANPPAPAPKATVTA